MPTATITNSPTNACSRLESILASLAFQLAVDFLRCCSTTHTAMIGSEHLQVVQFLFDFRFGDAIEKLPHARRRIRLHFRGSTLRDDIALVDVYHLIGNEKSTCQLVGHHDDGHMESLLQFEDELIDARGD